MLIPKGALVVSCQARADNPLHGPVYMSAMARAAEAGGARGIRANGAEDVAAIRAGHAAADHRHLQGLGRPLPGLHHARFRERRADRAGRRGHHRSRCHAATAGRRAGRPADRPHPRRTRSRGLRRHRDARRGQGGACLWRHLCGHDLVGLHRGDRWPQRRGAGPRPHVGPGRPTVPLPVVAEGRFDTPELVAEAFERGRSCGGGRNGDHQSARDHPEIRSGGAGLTAASVPPENALTPRQSCVEALIRSGRLAGYNANVKASALCRVYPSVQWAQKGAAMLIRRSADILPSEITPRGAFISTVGSCMAGAAGFARPLRPCRCARAPHPCPLPRARSRPRTRS